MIVSVSSGLDTFSRESETNEPAEMLVEDTSQSQGFAPWVDGSQSVENMENACNHMSNSDTIFSPVLNDELDGTGRGTCSCCSFGIRYPLFDI